MIMVSFVFGGVGFVGGSVLTTRFVIFKNRRRLKWLLRTMIILTEIQCRSKYSYTVTNFSMMAVVCAAQSTQRTEFSTMAMIPTSIITGTIGFLVLTAIAIGIVFSSRATGMLSKDNAAIANVVVSVATFSMWLFWLCAWMHQWHPLIQPIYEG